jgi:uncharacterized membrane-anchored protein
MKKIILPAFIIIALVQWIAPVKMIWDKETILQTGKMYRFETEPVDPSYPFRGRYIALNFKEDQFTIRTRRVFYNNQDIYVVFTEDARGFARIVNLSENEPAGQDNYFKAKVNYSYTSGDSANIHLSYPFDEFYMDEYKAPKAEEAYNESLRDSTKITYAAVKVYKGKAAIENVFIGDKTIRSLIEK